MTIKNEDAKVLREVIETCFTIPETLLTGEPEYKNIEDCENKMKDTLKEGFQICNQVMTKEPKHNTFVYALGSIENKLIRKTVEVFLSRYVPLYFWSIPASTSGRYHPDYALGEGGLVRHTKASVKIAISLFPLYNFTQYEKDVIISSLLLHDTFKCGTQLDYEDEQHTRFEHPILASDTFYVVSFDIISTILQQKTSPILFPWVNEICSCISSHMGQWCENENSSFILPTPKTELEKFVHLCDYLASRKFLEVKL